MKNHKNADFYDFSDYAEEITGNALFKINGGAEVENSDKGVAGAKPGDTITRKNGDVIVLKQADIDYANAQLRNNGNDGTGNTNGNSGTGNNSNSGSNNTSNSRSTNNSSSGANNTGISNTSTSESTPEVSEEIKQNSDAYANYMSLQGRAKDEGEPDRYKGYNVLGGGNTLVKVITSYDKTKDIEYFVKEIKERISYDLDLMNYVKENTKIVIERSPKDNGPNGDYYKSTLKIQMGEIVFFEGKVQSTADGASTGPGKTIPLGNYTGELYNKSASYLNAIHLKSNDKNIVIDNDIFIHPDARTALGFYNSYSKYNKPCSQGCPIEKYETFGSMTFTIKELGFKYGACTSINSGVLGDTIPVILTKGN